jgi:hypothetical protein
MKDQEAIERVKAILKECSPAARKAILELVSPPTAPKPRSILKSDVKTVEMPKGIGTLGQT